jgi:hypothetical protein
MAEEEKIPEKKGGKLRWWLWSLGVVILGGVIVGMLAAVVMGTFEPKYSDKPMSYWISELNGTNYIRREIAADALARIGEPAIDPLVGALRKERSFGLTLREKLWLKVPLKWQAKIPRPWGADVMQYNALIGLAAMGTNAARVAPEVILIFTNNSPALTSRATFALNRMGSNAYPALQAGLQSTNRLISGQCSLILSQARVDLPISAEQKASLQRLLAAPAVSGLEMVSMVMRLEMVRSSVIPVLEPSVEDSRPETRLRAAILLANFGRKSPRITELLIEDIDQLQDPLWLNRVEALLVQGPYLQPHYETLAKLAATSNSSIAMKCSLLLDNDFGRSEALWAFVDRLLAANTTADSRMAAGLLLRRKLHPAEQKEIVAALSKLLGSNDTNVRVYSLAVIERSPAICMPLKPEVEKLLARVVASPSPDQNREAQVERTLKTLQREEAAAKAKSPM